jgi:hypothetical protein
MIFLLRLRLAYGRSRSRDDAHVDRPARPPEGAPPGSRDLTALAVPAQTGHRNGWEERNANGPSLPGVPHRLARPAR